MHGAGALPCGGTLCSMSAPSSRRAASRQGAGAVHHVAFRTPNEEQYHAWARG